MNLLQANALIRESDRLFERAARAWERGNNSGDDHWMRHYCGQCDRYRQRAEALLTPLGIAVDYPGLYPSFTVNGFGYHDTASAVSAALEASAPVCVPSGTRPASLGASNAQASS